MKGAKISGKRAFLIKWKNHEMRNRATPLRIIMLLVWVVVLGLGLSEVSWAAQVPEEIQK